MFFDKLGKIFFLFPSYIDRPSFLFYNIRK